MQLKPYERLDLRRVFGRGRGRIARRGSVIMPDWNLLPGPSAVRDTAEANFLWNKGAFAAFDYGGIMGGAARDSGNSPTTILRTGLLLGKKTSDGKLYQFNAAATDGTQYVYGINVVPQKMVDLDGNNIDRVYGTCIAGYVKNAQLYDLTTGFSGSITPQARQQMRSRFIFDDDFYLPAPGSYFPFRGLNIQTANYQILATDNGMAFGNLGASGEVDFTLPAIGPGYFFKFIGMVNQTLKVISTEGTNVVTFNNAGATSVAYATTGHIIGGQFNVYSNPAGTLWIVEALGQSATLTVA